ncbi:Uncharacterized protein conserved in bacteria [Burkholderia pseudomallei]|nr:Uncharacterized protein conserved in bacteria [Burkholderia pseudomallei]
MRVIGLGVLSAFCDEHADCRKWVSNWIQDVKQSTWTTTHDIKLRYPSASFLAENIVIFNVRGNSYRLETQVALDTGVVAVKWIGTHAEYDKRKF